MAAVIFGKAYMKTSKWLVSFLIILAILLPGVSGCVGPASDLDFFRGKTVTIIVPNGTGGGIDAYARAVAPFLQKYLPGSKVEVQNITDHNGITGKNRVFAAQPDGLTLGFAPISGALLAEWEGLPGVEYKTARFSYIGRLIADPHIMVVSPRSGFTKLGDLIQAGKIRMGFAGVGSDDYYVGLITASLLGYQVQARTNFLSSSDAGLACVRGDIDAILFSDSSIHSQINEKTVVPVVTFSKTRLASLPDVPTIFEVLPGNQQFIMQALVQIYALDRTMIAPPDMPAGRLQVLREALDKAAADPEFLQNMAALKRPVAYLNGDEITSVLQSILASEDQIKPLVIKITLGAR